MAVLVTFKLDRAFPSVSFPRGSASQLALYWGYELFDRTQVPRTAFVCSSHQAVPDFVCINAKLAVCPEAQSLLETLEPDKHQRFEVSIQRLRGNKPLTRLDRRPLDMHYYLLNPTVRLDAVCLEKSKVRVATIVNRPPLVFAYPGAECQVVLKKSVIAGHHLWSGERQLGDRLFFSNHLANEIDALGLKGLDFTHLDET